VALDLNGTHQFQYANEVKFIQQVRNTWFWWTITCDVQEILLPITGWH